MLEFRWTVSDAWTIVGEANIKESMGSANASNASRMFSVVGEEIDNQIFPKMMKTGGITSLVYICELPK